MLVTRAAGQASALAEALEAEGATAILIPAIEIVPPASYCALDAALTTMLTYDWVLFTSANAVGASARRARTLNLPLHAKGIAAIGPSTAAAAQSCLTVEEGRMSGSGATDSQLVDRAVFIASATGRRAVETASLPCTNPPPMEAPAVSSKLYRTVKTPAGVI